MKGPRKVPKKNVTVFDASVWKMLPPEQRQEAVQNSIANVGPRPEDFYIDRAREERRRREAEAGLDRIGWERPIAFVRMFDGRQGGVYLPSSADGDSVWVDPGDTQVSMKPPKPKEQPVPNKDVIKINDLASFVQFFDAKMLAMILGTKEERGVGPTIDGPRPSSSQAQPGQMEPNDNFRRFARFLTTYYPQLQAFCFYDGNRRVSAIIYVHPDNPGRRFSVEVTDDEAARVRDHPLAIAISRLIAIVQNWGKLGPGTSAPKDAGQKAWPQRKVEL